MERFEVVLDDDLDEDRFDDDDDDDEDEDLGGVLLLELEELVPPLFRFILFLLRFCCLLIFCSSASLNEIISSG